jgi:hypothetical protein
MGMKTSKGIFVKPIWFLENHSWNTIKRKWTTFVLAYHPAFDNVAKTIRGHWPVIQKHQVMLNLPRITGSCILERAVVFTSKLGIGQCTECGDRRCITCKTWKQHGSSKAGSLGKNISAFAMSTSNLTTQFTFWNVVSVGSNTSMKQSSRSRKVWMVIGVTSIHLPLSRHLLSHTMQTVSSI